MGGSDREGAIADEVSGVTDDLDLVCWEVTDLATILKTLGISEILNGAMNKSSSLGVSGTDDYGIWTSSGSIVKEGLHLSDSGIVGTAWVEYGGTQCAIIDSLDGNSGRAESIFQPVTGWWPD
ncbi:hypothetical protein ABW20_dc0103091 [Dactylellina cionopaga]|nr:hypothetical protein ABW20_dc0103091 [Dactylellina cionopaga]